jgi:hypothetical protein
MKPLYHKGFWAVLDLKSIRCLVFLTTKIPQSLSFGEFIKMCGSISVEP